MRMINLIAILKKAKGKKEDLDTSITFDSSNNNRVILNIMENKNDEIEESSQYRQENATYINIRFIYVDATLNVVSSSAAKTETANLITFNDRSILSRESVLHIIQSNKKISELPNKFSLSKILLYNIDIEPQNIQVFTNQNRDNDLDVSPFLKELAFTDDIQIDPSLPIFHPVNCLYFIYQEISLDKKKKNRTKKMKLVIPKNRKTKKKVSINENNIIY